MWPDMRLCELLGIDVPIIQAPMAGTTTPDLVAAVSNAGGLGSHGYATLSVDTLQADIQALNSRTNRPVNLNFFCHEPPVQDQNQHTAMLATMAPAYAAAGVEAPSGMPKPGFEPFGETHFEVLLAHPPAVVSFHFGLPPAELNAVDAL